MKIKIDPATLFMYQLTGTKLPYPKREFRFHEKRQWRFDFAWPESKLAVEIEGGTWINGRHTRGLGYAKDCEKYNEATRAGWKVYRFTSNMIIEGKAIKFLLECS